MTKKTETDGKREPPSPGDDPVIKGGLFSAAIVFDIIFGIYV